jgi:hypothetical protein
MKRVCTPFRIERFSLNQVGIPGGYPTEEAKGAEEGRPWDLYSKSNSNKDKLLI